MFVAPSLTFLNVLKYCCLELFSWRKTQQKKPAVRKIFYLISPQLEHYNSNRFWKLQCRAAAFIFFHSKNLVMWPPSQCPIGWSLACIIMLIFVSSTFWSSLIIFIFLGIYSGIWKQYLTCLVLPKFGSVRFRPPFLRTWTWTSYKISEPEPNLNREFGSGLNLLNLVIFLNHIFQFFSVSKRFETHVQSLEISYLCKAVALTMFDKPNRYYTTNPNKCMCRKDTWNIAISHPGEGLISYNKILK